MIEKSRTARIRVLDPHVVNQIAAGEVVERPASVVKELVENALDAHATRVEVFCERGGTQLIRVVDDGWGMEREDLELAFHPHATSKLESPEDLERIATLGFRGEALASIGAVSQARVVTRARGAAAGLAIENHGGRIGEVRAAAAAPGTEIAVRNLFYNTPARARFLRAPRTELGHVESAMTRFALAFPEVAFRLVHEGKELLATEPGETREERLRRLAGPEIAGRLLVARAEAPFGRLEAYLSPPSLSRADASGMLHFLNGRAIRDRVLHRVLRDVYRDLLHGGRYPVAYVFLDLDPAQVDVNVHPTKAEVRWRDPRTLHSFVGPALRRALREADLATGLDEPGPERAWPHAEGAPGAREAMLDWFRRGENVREGEPSPAYPAAAAGARGAAPPLVFQLHDSYLVCEVEDGIAIVDQHALHERVCYDRILKRLSAGPVEAQRLLVPEQVALDAARTALMEEHRDLLARCGFSWSPFGGGAVAVDAAPAILPRERVGDVLRDLLDLFARHGAEVDARQLFHDVADTMACKAAVRFGDRMSREEAEALLRESGALDKAFVCPHGRPTVLRLSFSELEKRFGRR